MNKTIKIALLVTGALAILAGAYFGWEYLNSAPTYSNPTDSADNNGSVGAAKLQILTNAEVFDFWMNKKTNEIYYLTKDGKISKLLEDKSSQAISSQNIPDLSYVEPSSDGLLALIAFGFPQSPSFSVFNTANKSFQPLPQGTTAVDWDPLSNNRVVYLKNGAGSSVLSILDLSSKKSSEIIKIFQKDLSLDWTSADIVYLNDRPSGEGSGSTWSLNIKSKIFKTISAEKPEVEIKWLTSKIGLKSSLGLLSLINTDGKETNTIRLRAAANKCLNDRLLIFCSAPLNQNSKTNSFDAELKKPSTQEGIYVISLVDYENRSSLLASSWPYNNELDTPINAARLEKQGGTLILLNRFDHLLYSISL
ncbi:MAG: hypothetical protein AAB389_02735 [Patescibacteria group bacterium]